MGQPVINRRHRYHSVQDSDAWSHRGRKHPAEEGGFLRLGQRRDTVHDGSPACSRREKALRRHSSSTRYSGANTPWGRTGRFLGEEFRFRWSKQQTTVADDGFLHRKLGEIRKRVEQIFLWRSFDSTIKIIITFHSTINGFSLPDFLSRRDNKLGCNYESYEDYNVIVGRIKNFDKRFC